MKNTYLYIIIILLLFFPLSTFAVEGAPDCPNYDEETKTCTLSLCLDGCDDLNPNSIRFYQDVETLIINLQNDTYPFYYPWMNFYVDNVIINGNNSTLTYSDGISTEQRFRIVGRSLKINDLNIDFPLSAYGSNYVELNNIRFTVEHDDSSLIIEGEPDSKINNSTIKGIFAQMENTQLMEIDNSDIRSQNHCSLIFAKRYSDTSNKFKILPSFLSGDGEENGPSFLPDNQTPDVIIKNTKLNCAEASASGGLSSAIYIDSTNEWEDNVIDRSDNGNVLEEGDGKIYIETSNNESVEVSTDDDLSLSDYFDNIVNINNVIWEVEDDTIARIENNKIIPLKPGTTNIYGTEGRNFYKLAFTVREDVVEPTPTPTATPVVEPTPNATLKPTEPVKDEDVKVPDTYAFSLIMVLIAIVASAISAFYLSKEEN